MATYHPGVGDPSGFENPYKDGRSNWSLQVRPLTPPPPPSAAAANSHYAEEFLLHLLIPPLPAPQNKVRIAGPQGRLSTFPRRIPLPVFFGPLLRGER